MARGRSVINTKDNSTTPPTTTPSTPTSVNNIKITPGADSVPGTAGPDHVNGKTFYNIQSGNYGRLNLEATDIDCGAGDDTIDFDTDTDQTPQSIINCESHYNSNKATSAKTIGMDYVQGAKTITAIKSNAGLTLSGIGEKPDAVGVSSTNDKPVTFTVKSSVLSGSNDAVQVKINNYQDAGNGVITIQPSVAGSGFETFNVYVYGEDSVVKQLTDGNGNSLKTINFSGDKSLTIATVALDSTVTTIDASAKTAGGVVIGTAGSITVPSAVTVIKGGAGDDTFYLGTTFNEDTKTYLGGAGTDTIGMTSAKAASITTSNTVTDSKFNGWEVLAVEDALGGNIDLTLFGSTAQGVILHNGAGARTITLPDNATITTKGTAHSGTLTLLPKENLFSYDVTLTIPAEASAADHINGQSISAAKHHKLILNSDINTAQTANAVTVGTLGSSDADTSLVIQGEAAWTISGAVTADKIDASGLSDGTGLTMSTTTSTSHSTGVAIIGSSSDDVLYGSTGVDNITGGAGDDTLNGGAGSDSLTGGVGADKFVFAGVTIAANGQDRILDFSHSDVDLIDLTVLSATLGSKIASAGAAVSTTDRTGFAVIIDTDGTAGSITSGGSAAITKDDLEATTLTDVAAFLAEKFSGVSSTTGTDNGVYIINFMETGHTKSYVYGWDNDTTANVVQAAELALIGIITRADTNNPALVNADITV